MRIKNIYGVALLAVCSLSSPILFASNADAYPIPSIQAPTDIREELVWYSDNNAGVMFIYPKRFASQHISFSGLVAYLSGQTGTGANGELQLWMKQSDIDVEQFAKHEADSFAKTMRTMEYEPGKMERVRFGRNSSLSGITRVASVRLGGTKFHQRVTYWSLNGRIYSFSMRGPENQWAQLDPLYNYILLSIAPYGSSGGASTSPGESKN